MIWPNTWLSREPTFSFQSFVSELHFVTWESGSGAIDADVGHQRDWLLSFYGTSGPAKVQTALNEIIIEDKKKRQKKEGMQLADGLEIFRFVYGFSWPRARREEKVVAIWFLTRFPRSNILPAPKAVWTQRTERKLPLSSPPPFEL